MSSPEQGEEETDAPAPQRVTPGEHLVFTDEGAQLIRDSRDPIPPRERTRRSVLIGLTVAFTCIFLLQLSFAVIGGALWDRVGPILSTAATLVAAGFGYVWGHYFSGRD